VSISTNASGMTRAETSASVPAIGCPPKLVIQITDIGKRFTRRCMRCQLEELYSGGASRMSTSTDTIMAVALHGIGMSAAQRDWPLVRGEGTFGCEHGVCGAGTVQLDGRSVRSS